MILKDNSIVSDFATEVHKQLKNILFNISHLITGLSKNYNDVREIKILVEKYRLIFTEILKENRVSETYIAEDKPN